MAPPARPHGIGYRPEVDGLRAVAVVPVMLFHAGLAPFAGGFLGVDVFFVISGYLITSILLQDLSAKRFSFARFYERRARRLLPALVPVLLVSFVAGLVWMLPSELASFSRTLVATVLFASNVQLWRAGGDYFSASQEENPLLHTWSLSVEEQYYLLFPAALLLLWRCTSPRVQVLVLGGVALGSLALAEAGSRTVPGGTFFLLPTRGWELLAGVLCAYAHASGERRANGALAALGLGLLLASFALFDGAVRMPSAFGLAPVAGTCLLLLFASAGAPAGVGPGPGAGTAAGAGGGNAVGRLLALRPLVYLGLISYGAYLWHQPILAFLRIRLYGEAPTWALCAGLVGALGLAAASERWIERPFRARVVPPDPPAAAPAASASAPARRVTGMRVPLRGLLAATVLPGIAFVAAGAFIVRDGGMRDRFTPAVAAADAASRLRHDAECRRDEAYAANLSGETEICTVGAPDVAPATIVIGDSHASVLVDAFDEALGVRGEAVTLYSGGWCAPIPGLVADHPEKNPDVCPRLVEMALHRVETDPAVKRVILVAEWANYTQGLRWGDPFPARYALLEPGSTGPAGAAAFAAGDVPAALANADVFRAGWRRTLDRLGALDVPVVVAESVPEFEAPVARSVARALLHAGAESAGPGKPAAARDVVAGLRVDRADYARRNAAVLDAFDAEALPPNVRRLPMPPTFCPSGPCRYADDAGAPLYSDASHLTLAGARPWVAAVLALFDDRVFAGDDSE